MMRLLPVALMTLVTLSSCMKWEDGAVTDVAASGNGVFIVCEGNFQYGNATLSYYDPESRHCGNELFYHANGMKLGDVGQSMTIRDGVGWIVVNSSHVIFAVDATTVRERGRVTGLSSPRYIHFVNDRKAYVSQLWDNRIAIIDPESYSVIGHIVCPDMSVESGSTEQMVQCGEKVYVCCWSYQNRIMRIDTASDRVDGVLTVGCQPREIAVDARGKLWVLTDGGYPGSPAGYEAPAMYRIDPEEFRVERMFRMEIGNDVSGLCMAENGNMLYWIDGGIWRMPIDSDRLPDAPVIPTRDTKYFGLTVSPYDGDIYVADAIDYQQPGVIYRYTAEGDLIGSFTVGVNPTAFCWK